jgi:hypothetical protein
MGNGHTFGLGNGHTISFVQGHGHGHCFGFGNGHEMPATWRSTMRAASVARARADLRAPDSLNRF